MRLFVAVWPSPEVVEVLAALHRPEHPAVRWTGPEQWHVTLRFLGDVAADEVPGLIEALAAVGSRPPRMATLGPASARLGRNVLVAPVAGVDDLGATVAEATRAYGAPPEDRPFTGHLTLARARSRHSIPPRLGGVELHAAWKVAEVAVVRSHLGSSGAHYETLATVPLASS